MKTCFKCGQAKSYQEFYKHPKMGDGYLGKCKDCAKKDSEARRQEKLKDPLWAEKEAERHRIKSQKYTVSGVAKETLWRLRLKKKGFPITLERRAKRSQEQLIIQRRANSKARSAVLDGKISKNPCEVCGSYKSQGHHEDYGNPLELTWLCSKHHRARHVHLWDMEILGKEPIPILEYIAILKEQAKA